MYFTGEKQLPQSKNLDGVRIAHADDYMKLDFRRVGQTESTEVHLLDRQNSDEKAILLGPEVPPEVRKEMAAQATVRLPGVNGLEPQAFYANLPGSLKIGEMLTFMDGPNFAMNAVNIPTASVDGSLDVNSPTLERIDLTRLEGGAVALSFVAPEAYPDFQIQLAVFPTDSPRGEMVVVGPERDEATREWYKEMTSQAFQELGVEINPSALLYRAVPRDLQLSLSSSFQAGLEAETLGTELSGEESIIPHLIDFYERNNKIEMHFAYNGKVHHVKGVINQKSEKEFEVELIGPNSDEAGLDQMRISIANILRVKKPELGDPDIQYRGQGKEVALLPTLKEFTEQPGGEHFTLTYGISDDNEFEVTVLRNASYDKGSDVKIPSLTVFGPDHGAIATEWMRLRVMQDFTNQRPNLKYDGATAL